MSKSDVLILPTFVESFGMVALEAVAHGMALIATDVYALKEILEDQKNGVLLKPPISVWDEIKPSNYHYDLVNIKQHIKNTDKKEFEEALFESMGSFATNETFLSDAKARSKEIFYERFQ